jgi:hypothetical protein
MADHIADVNQAVVQHIMPQVIDKLREATKPPGGRSIWLHNLTDEELTTVFVMLQEGRKYGLISSAIQSWGYAFDDGNASRLFKIFKQRTMGDAATIFKHGYKKTKEQKAVGAKVYNRLRYVERQLDEVQAMAHLYDDQKKRLDFWMSLETSGDIDVGKQINAIVDSLRNIAKDRFNMRSQIGAIKTKPTESRVDVRLVHELAVKNIENVNDVIEVTSTLRDSLDDLAVPMLPSAEIDTQEEHESDRIDFEDSSS